MIPWFLAWLARKRERVSVFTLASENILVNLDPEGAVIRNILSRSCCTPRRHGGKSKELHLLDRDLRRTLLVDNDCRVVVQLDTGIHVDGFTCDSTDQEPGRVRVIIQEILQAEDVRKIARSTLKLRADAGST